MILSPGGYMMTSSNGKIFRITRICAGSSPGTGEFPAQRPVTRKFDVFFDLCPNKQLSKQWWGWWFETSSHPLWHHRNDKITYEWSMVPEIVSTKMLLHENAFHITGHLWGEFLLHGLHDDIITMKCFLHYWPFVCMESIGHLIKIQSFPLTKMHFNMPLVKGQPFC